MIELTQEELKQHFSEPIFGQIAETAVAIAIMINIYRNIRSIQVNKLDELKW